MYRYLIIRTLTTRWTRKQCNVTKKVKFLSILNISTTWISTNKLFYEHKTVLSEVPHNSECDEQSAKSVEC
jgi:hypothetical protein